MSKSGSKIREQVAHFLVDIHNWCLFYFNTDLEIYHIIQNNLYSGNKKLCNAIKNNPRVWERNRLICL